MLECQFPVLIPTRIGRDIFGDHRRIAIGGRAATADLRTDFLVLQGFVVGIGQARCGYRGQSLALLIQHQDRAHASLQLLFHDGIQVPKDDGQGLTVRQHFQQLVVTVELLLTVGTPGHLVLQFVDEAGRIILFLGQLGDQFDVGEAQAEGFAQGPAGVRNADDQDDGVQDGQQRHRGRERDIDGVVPGDGRGADRQHERQVTGEYGAAGGTAAGHHAAQDEDDEDPVLDRHALGQDPDQCPPDQSGQQDAGEIASVPDDPGGFACGAQEHPVYVVAQQTDRQQG